MNGAVLLLPLYAFIARTEIALLFLPLTYLTVKTQNLQYKYQTMNGE